MENEYLSYPDENFHFFGQSSYFLVPQLSLICIQGGVHFDNQARNGPLLISTIRYANHAFRIQKSQTNMIHKDVRLP